MVPKLYGVRAEQPALALTFDDGPDPENTPSVLALLRKYDAHATFFAVGQAAQRYPALIRRAAAAGNEIGNHGWNHYQMTALAREGLKMQVERSAALIARLTGRRPQCLRPPYGALNGTVTQVANSLGETVVLWTYDPQDWRNPPAAAIARNVLNNLHPGSIVLLHDGGGPRKHTVQALALILQGMRARGYRAVTVQDLMRLGPAVATDSQG